MDQIVRDSIQYGTTTICFDLVFEDRKTLNIRVNPNGSVFLKAPNDSTLDDIREKVRKRAAWILRQRRYFESFGTPTVKRQYISGESHLYLGRQYMLRVKEGSVNAVHYQNNIIEIECRHKKDVGVLLQTWYHQRADIKFKEYARPIVERFSVYGVKPQSIAVKNMDKRWGYCTTDGHISLNARLVCAPRCCIEYVITHELCHLVYRNHDKDFYNLLSKEMPHWEKWKNKLERIMI